MPFPRRCFSLVHGLIVMHHIVDDVPADALRNGLSPLGAAVVGSYTLPATQPPATQPPATQPPATQPQEGQP
jgi:hypothetical protein